MGFTYIKILVCNPMATEKKKEVEVLVDTGAVFSVIPRDILEEVGIKPTAMREFKIFGGRKVERETGGALFQYDSVRAEVPVTFGEKEDKPILGVTALESLGYNVDPVTKKLKKVDLLML